MTEICPFCKEPMPAFTRIPLLHPRKQRIYNAVAGAGREGIDSEDLLVRMYADDEMPTPGGMQVLRVKIHEINKAIAVLNQRIVSAFRGRYVLKEIGREEEVKETDR